jgi:hypothetical protein
MVGANRAGPPREGDDPLLLQSCSFNLSSLALLNLAGSILLLADLFTGALASQCGLDALLLTGLQVKRVALDLFNDVFLLHLALETAQSILKGFTLLQSNFRQSEHTPKPVLMDGYYVTRTR